MRIYALILTLFVLRAHAASINNKPEKKIDDLDNVELDDVSDLKSDTWSVKSDGTANKIIADIPVAVIENQAVKKLDENSNDYVPEDDTSVNIKRLEVDLENPGPPQRQEHETQNPDSFSDIDKAVEAVKLKAEDTKQAFNEGLKSIAIGLQTVFTPSEDLPRVQADIQKLKIAFANKFEDLSKAVQPFIRSNGADTKSDLAGVDSNVNIIESRLKSVEQSFENGVNTLSEGVELLTIIREEDKIEKAKEEAGKAKNVAVKDHDWSETEKEIGAGKAESSSSESPYETSSAATPEPSSTASPTSGNPIVVMMQNFASLISNSISGLTSSVQNSPLNQIGQNNQNSGSTDSTTKPPSGFDYISNVFNIFTSQVNPSQISQVQQNQQPASTQSDEPTAARPSVVEFVQGAWQNFVSGGQSTQTNPSQPQGPFSFIPNIAQLLNPQNAAQQPANQQAGSNVTPQSNTGQDQPSNTQPSNPPGPIQNIIQNNPIVKGIQSAVQRIQSNGNADTPRDPTSDKREDIKGVATKGYGGYQSGDNNDVNVDVTAEEPVKVEAASEIVQDSEREETPHPEVLEKTE